MRRYTINLKYNRLYFIIASVAFAIAIYLFGADVKENYEWLFMLPLVSAFSFITLCIFNVSYKHNIGVLCVIGLSFVRFTIHPALLHFGNYAHAFAVNVEEKARNAIWLMVFELVAITITLIVTNSKSFKSRVVATRHFVKRKWLRNCLLFLTVFCIVTFIVFPSTRGMFNNILHLSDYDFTVVTYKTTENAAGSLVRIMQTLCGMFFHFIRILVPVYVIYNKSKSGASEIKLYMWALLFSVLQFFFITSTFAESIISAAVVLLVTVHLCPNFGNRFLSISVVAVLSVFLIFFGVRFTVKYTYTGIESVFQYISFIVNAYFTGVVNVAGIFYVPAEFKSSALFFDLYGAIPFNTTLFGLSGQKLQSYFNLYTGGYGQIVPSIAAGYYYFGGLFAPFFSCLFTFCAVKYGKKADRTTYAWRYVAYIFLAMMFSLGISMYSPAIVFSWYTTWGLPMHILATFSDEKM